MHRYRLTWVLKYSSLVLGVSVCRIDVLLCCCIVSCHPSLGGRVGTRLLVVPRCRRLGVVPREFGLCFVPLYWNGNAVGTCQPYSISTNTQVVRPGLPRLGSSAKVADTAGTSVFDKNASNNGVQGFGSRRARVVADLARRLSTRAIMSG